MTSCLPLAVSIVCPLGLLVNNFMLDQTALLSAMYMYFSVSFGEFIVTIYMYGRVDKSTRSCPDVSASLGLLKYTKEGTDTVEGPERPKRLDRNVSSC